METSACIKLPAHLAESFFFLFLEKCNFFIVSLYFFPNDSSHDTLDFLILSEDQNSLLFLQSCLYATWLAITAEYFNLAYIA